MQCPRCQHESLQHAKFCLECGRPSSYLPKHCAGSIDSEGDFTTLRSFFQGDLRKVVLPLGARRESAGG